MARFSALVLLAAACGPKAPPPAPVAPPPPAPPAHRTSAPAPLAARPFVLPEAARGRLSNGLEVVVVENHEVPMVYVTLVHRAGSIADPPSAPGTASMAWDMLNEGAGGLSAEALSLASRRLGASIDTDAGLDAGLASMSALKVNLAPSLDLFAKVLLQPDFPARDFKLLQDRRVSDLKAARQDPGSIAGRVWAAVNYPEAYGGRLSSEAAYRKMTPAQLKAWYTSHVGPQDAILLVGGDTTLAEVQPLLEARFGKWAPPKKPAKLPKAPGAEAFASATEPTIFLVDKPGAAQSVLRVGQFVPPATAPTAAAFTLADLAVSGEFTARVNMNLREDKGWTYGAYSGVRYDQGPGLWAVRTNVVTPHTADAIAEIRKEITASLADRPVTADELAAARGGLLGTWPLGFQQPGTLLSSTSDIWLYGYPADWVSGFIARHEAPDLAAVNAAWKAAIDPARFRAVVVGDAASIQAPLEALGMKVVRVDTDGKPVAVK
jgi:zinc protease